MRKVVFLDKDGTIIPDIPYNIEPSLITLNPGVVEGLAFLKKLDFDFIIVTNQAGVAFNYFDEKKIHFVFEKINNLLKPWNITIKASYYCPHHPEGINPIYSINCSCRKPMPGLFNIAKNDLRIDLNNSWMIGDILNDIEAGKRAGCKSILIDNGNETEWLMNEYRKPDFVAANFLEAAKHIEKLTQTDTLINEKQMASL